MSDDIWNNADKHGPVYAAITHVWGERCPDFEPNCPCCRAWAEFDNTERLRARVTELEGQHKGMVLNNAILRERPDLPLNRIPATRAMTKLYEDNERLRAALTAIRNTTDNAERGDIARAALEVK